MRTKLKNLWMISSAASALGIVPTAAERRAGRLLRAPDHDAGTGAGAGADSGNGGGAGNGDGGSGGNGAPGGAADPGAGAQAGAGDGAGGAGSGGEGQSADGGAADGGSGDAAAGGEDKTILGGAVDDDGNGDGSGNGGDAGKQEGETRLQFGEGDDAKAILGAPEAYEVTLSEELTKAGITFDKEAFDAVEPILRDLNLSNDAAQALTSAYAEKILPLLQKRAGEANDALGADMRRQWSEATAKEFDGREGRASMNEVKALCRQAFIRGGVKADSPFLTFLEESGLGSHPDMVRTMAFFGRSVGEAAIEAGNGAPAPQRLADRVYGQPVPRD